MNPPIRSRLPVRLALFMALAGTSALGSFGAEPLWEIGKPDGSNAEFALAPDGYARFQTDAFFVVGESDPKRDWPYAQPGPADGWAGSQRHTFTVRFGLKDTPPAGNCRLEIRLLDTQAGAPPRLRVDVNGHAFDRDLPRGGGDASIHGSPASGRQHTVAIEFPASDLRAGDNDVNLTTLSGSWLLYDSLRFDAPAGTELAPTKTRTALILAEAVRALRRDNGRLVQPVQLTLSHHGAETTATIRLAGSEPKSVQLRPGQQTVDCAVPAVERATPVRLTVETGGQVLAEREITVKPVRKLTVYVLPHSHTDIGYTELQTAIEEKQVNNLLRGIEIARQTADYPEGARFVWNVEVLWAADLYLHRLGPDAQAAFLDAVKRGQVALNGMYLNELTGLCRPEELLRLFRFATKLGAETGVPIDSAMISDVPGYTWSTVTAMAQAGIRYFSVAPNYFDRIGDILQKWENKPFYWISPSRKEKVLVWIPWRGYAMSHIVNRLSPRFVEEYEQQLEQSGYPYDIAYMRWAGHGDNAVPDEAICEFIKDWNTHYEWPRFVISSTGTAFRAFEERYGKELPEARGDWTPYWEDGAGSSSQETGLNRASSDRVAQAESLWAMLNPATYPAAAFDDAWRNVLLYSEHTWGAWCSISEPARQETLDQWSIKHGYAAEADLQSRALLSRAQALMPGTEVPNAVDIYNSASWPRTELVTIPRDFSEAGSRVTDDAGKPVPSQRLVNGDLVVLVRDLPPFAGKRFTISGGEAFSDGKATAAGAGLDNGLVRVRLDEKTGGIAELRVQGVNANLVDAASGQTVNDYLYLIGDNLADLQRSGPAKIRVKERGPLVASLVVESDAPGCHRLTREVRSVAGLDQIELINLVDKARLLATDYHAKNGKESLNFAFPFNVPDGALRMELPFAVMRPEQDQIPSACKNWFTAGRWVDVANADYGVTWVTLDAPLVEVGGLTAILLNSQTNPEVWRKHVEPTQKFYSWAMNNHWGTNYRAYQEGPVVFRYLLRPHRGYDPVAATRLAIAQSQPLVPIRGRGAKPSGQPRLRLSADNVLVTGLKPADDGRALIVRLWNSSDRDATTRIDWAEPKPVKVSLSDTSEQPRADASGEIQVPAWGLVTLRAELPAARAF